MSDIGTGEASKRWGYSQETVRKWCAIGLIKGATQDKKGSAWHIPQNIQRKSKTAICCKKFGGMNMGMKKNLSTAMAAVVCLLFAACYSA